MLDIIHQESKVLLPKMSTITLEYYVWDKIGFTRFETL